MDEVGVWVFWENGSDPVFFAFGVENDRLFHLAGDGELGAEDFFLAVKRDITNVAQAAESSLIPYTLAIYTGSRAEAVAQYGSLKGMALPLLFFPFSVLGALSGLLMPEITRAHTKGDTAAMRRLIFTMLRMTGAFSLAAGAGMPRLGGMCSFWASSRRSCIWRVWWTAC